MELVLIPTARSGHPTQQIDNVRSYQQKGLWTVEIEYLDNSTEHFYSIEKIIDKPNTKDNQCKY